MNDLYKAGTGAESDTVETLNFEPIRGYPMLQWRGKRPFTSTHFYPAQIKEQHGSAVDGWLNKIYWGDNLQVMSHLLKHYRGGVNLVYIDPPFDSNADYKKTVSLRGSSIKNDANAFEEKQYTDIWTNDEYLQFMYERIVLLKELLSSEGAILIHLNHERVHLIRLILDEVFGDGNFRNDIVWKNAPAKSHPRYFGRIKDTILFYTKSSQYTWNKQYVELSAAYKATFKRQDSKGFYVTQPLHSGKPAKDVPAWHGIKPPEGRGWAYKIATLNQYEEEGKIEWSEDGIPRLKRYLHEIEGAVVQDVWDDIPPVLGKSSAHLNYPTQKPEALIARIIKATTNPGDLILDCFMGSGTTQAVAMKLGRRFVGADINLGAVQTTTKRLIKNAEIISGNILVPASGTPTLDLEINEETEEGEIADLDIMPNASKFYTGFEVYNVNNYEIFRNPIEAKDLLIEALELQKLQAGHLFDGELDGRLWKIMSINKIATRQDLNEIISGLNLRALADRLSQNPNLPAEKITLVCMGHEPDLAATLNQEVALSLNVKAGTKMPLDVQVLDILRDRNDLQFKRDSEARVSVTGDQLVIEAFYPMNLLAKLSLQKEKVGDWREMVDSVMVDFNYDGAVFNPALVDIPEKNELVSGSYLVPDDAGTIRVKITDVLSESLELEVQA